MRVHNEEIARALDEIADLLEIEEANPFRVRAYRNGARTVRGLGRELAEMVAEGEDLSKLPNIGKELAAKIREMVKSGHLKALDRLHRRLPESLEELLHLPGLGPKRVRALYRELGIETVPQLEQAIHDGRVGQLPGFGDRLQEKLLGAIAAHCSTEERMPRHVAARYAAPLVAWLEKAPGVEEVIVAGSFRRGKETVGDLDILVTAPRGGSVMKRFTGYDEVAQVLSGGETRASVVLRSGLQVDLRVVPRRSFGAALHYFTGNKAHNIQVRRRGQKRGLKINEYGVFRGRERVAGETEASLFSAVGLPWIPPEIRHGSGEIEAAEAGRLPELVERRDLRGDLHCHTKATDGHAAIREMALAAKAAGLKYLAVTDHSRRLAMVHGLGPSRLAAQGEQIDRLNEELKGITLLKGIEVDILEDGSLDLPRSVLCKLDLVVGAVHGHFNLSRAQQTRRIQRAMESPCFSILAHPTGRLLGEREGYAVDMERIIETAAGRGCFLELNGQPLRLDLDDRHCRMAKEAGVLVSIDSDGHACDDFGFLEYGVTQARRGWLERGDVLNTRSLAALRKLLRRTIA